MRLRRWKVHKLGFKDFSGIEYINKKLPMPADTQAGAQASLFASQRSYECMDAESAEKDVTPIARIRAGLEATLDRVPQRARRLNMMSSVQPVNELLRPVEQENSEAFAIMAVPEQMADSFLCQKRHLPEKRRNSSPLTRTTEPTTCLPAT